MPKKGGNILGAWAFTIGVLLAVIFAFVALAVPVGAWLTWTLFIIGIIVGFLNIADVETQPFLIAGVILVIIAALGSAAYATILFVPQLLTNLLVLFVPATIVVALKSLFAMAKG